MKHDRVPSLRVWQEGGGRGGEGSGWGGLQKEATPCEVGAVWLDVKPKIPEETLGPEADAISGVRRMEQNPACKRKKGRRSDYRDYQQRQTGNRLIFRLMICESVLGTPGGQPS